ncbi:hypothetical protein Moror_1647 [Moniliophthora roreri MCA 2997]|uniref:Uncharacterized protein n=2 Tax=Moniliophthora roreri TaxID=221103 RepID=V2YPA6_MONRO|nr:hypothetical protein Moror_1647 [Moniliophthora roreri MCA 2997]
MSHSATNGKLKKQTRKKRRTSVKQDTEERASISFENPGLYPGSHKEYGGGVRVVSRKAATAEKARPLLRVDDDDDFY